MPTNYRAAHLDIQERDMNRDHRDQMDSFESAADDYNAGTTQTGTGWWVIDHGTGYPRECTFAELYDLGTRIGAATTITADSMTIDTDATPRHSTPE